MEAQNNFLSPHDRKQCEPISTRSDTHGQRAKALLALDDGASQTEAAEQASLSVGQVRYALARYRKVGLDMFPQDILAQATAEKEESPAPQPVSETLDAAVSSQPAADIEKEPPPKKEKQGKKKSKKSKKDKKDKQKKKDKAAKQGKKKSGQGKRKKKKQKK